MVKVGINGAYPPTTRAHRIDARRPSPPWIEPRAHRLHLPVNLPGFGRIGRLAFRLAYDHPEFEFVHINEFPGAGESSAYLAKYDSVHGQWPKDCAFVDGNIVVDGKPISYSTHSTPGDVPWDQHGVELVLECSGEFLTRDTLNVYFTKGVKKVLVSAPVKEKEDPVLNIVYGVNHDKYDHEKDHIVTAASCTTNCLAPVVAVVQKNLGIVRGSITTIHNVTNTQTIVDAPNSKKSDLRRARSGLTNLAPTSTGSATAIALIFPELKGKLNGMAVRVPLLNGSLTDCVFEVARETSVEEVNALMEEASKGWLKGVLGYETQPLVSTDYINDTRSGIVDALSTMVVDKTHLKMYVWYDNEYGYSARMVDIALMIAKKM
jgi:glyceraldehyde 3-phosphate dehydrogenase